MGAVGGPKAEVPARAKISHIFLRKMRLKLAQIQGRAWLLALVGLGKTVGESIPADRIRETWRVRAAARSAARPFGLSILVPGESNMSVFLENRRRDGDVEPEAKRPAARASGVPAFLSRPRAAPPKPDAYRAPLWGLSYDRVEGVIHLVLAFTIVGGATAIMSTALFGAGVPLGGASETQPEIVAPKTTAAVAAPVERDSAPKSAQAAKSVQVNGPASELAPLEAPKPIASAPKAAALDPFFDARPMTETAPAQAPQALAPPPAAVREKLATVQGDENQETAPPPESANVAQLPAAPAPEAKSEPAAPATQAEAPRDADDARMAKCYLKLAGRVQNSGACKVHHTAEAVTFDLPGKPLEIAHKHGRVWTATLGGRNLGQVYKTGACWGAKGFYACENG